MIYLPQNKYENHPGLFSLETSRASCTSCGHDSHTGTALIKFVVANEILFYSNHGRTDKVIMSRGTAPKQFTIPTVLYYLPPKSSDPWSLSLAALLLKSFSHVVLPTQVVSANSEFRSYSKADPNYCAPVLRITTNYLSDDNSRYAIQFWLPEIVYNTSKRGFGGYSGKVHPTLILLRVHFSFQITSY